ncbi:recombinase family protein [Buttiauxella noackiae]|uniref:recombinase family protein n=1 Tax=Buttiauxella noackiae TaxID=82992 RepID=UPI0028D53CA9|nr:recombinase family protein [Buttiauxella noackiae]
MKIVTYYRISKKGTGLGLESQKDYCDTAIRSNDWSVVGTFTDDGLSGSLPASERPGLKAALALCKEKGACLLVAKIDRLARRVSESALIMEQVCIKVATMPAADNFQLHLFAALAEQERDFIRTRTKDALQKLQDRADNGDTVSQDKIARRNGNAAKVHQQGNIASAQKRSALADNYTKQIEDNILAAISKGYTSYRKLAEYLNNKGIKTRHGKEWSAVTVRRVKLSIDGAKSDAE